LLFRVGILRAAPIIPFWLLITLFEGSAQDTGGFTHAEWSITQYHLYIFFNLH